MGRGVDHPFRTVCKGMRDTWLSHPFSLPFRVRRELVSIEHLALTHDKEAQLLHALITSAVAPLKKKMELLEKEVEARAAKEREEDCRAQLLERALSAYFFEDDKTGGRYFNTHPPLPPQKNLNQHLTLRGHYRKPGEEIGKKEREVRELIAKLEAPLLEMLHRYDRDTYCWYQWTVSFKLGDIKLSSVAGRDADRCYHGNEELDYPRFSEDEECFKKTAQIYNLSSLTADELEGLCVHLLEVEYDTYKWNETYD